MVTGGVSHRAVRHAFEEQAIPCKVSYSGGRPIIFLPERKSNPQIPTGSVEVTADGGSAGDGTVAIAGAGAGGDGGEVAGGGGVSRISPAGIEKLWS